MTSAANDFVAGCTGGVAQVLVGQPFDIVKVRLQAASSSSSQIYNSAVDCLTKILKNEGGPFALWKGTLPPIMGIGAAVSVQFGVNEKTKQYARKLTGLSRLRNPHLFGCGLISGLVNALISTPVEHTRIRLQMQGGSVRASASRCVHEILKIYGIKGLYKGGIPTMWRDSIAFGIYFSVYEWIISQFLRGNQTKTDINMLAVAFAGGMSGILLWIATFPIDIIKTKIQADSLTQPVYKGMKDCFNEVYQRNGLKGFYKGITPCLMRAVPVNSATFLTYEATSKMLKDRKIIGTKYRFSV